MRSKAIDPDNPPLTAADFVRARPLNDEEKSFWEKAVGRPRSADPKQQVTVRLDSAVIRRLKAGGRGWQTRLNETLRKALKIG